MSQVAKWLFRSRGWSVPSSATLISASINRHRFLHEFDVAASTALGIHPGFDQCPWPITLGTFLRSYGSKATAAAPTGGAGSAGSEGNTGAQGSQDSADAEDLKVLSELRNMTMEGYVEYCKKMRSGSTPPRPRLPPLRFSRAENRAWVDEARVSFLRLQQHERIGSLITKEESDLILEKRKEVLYDRAFMAAIADRTGVYIDLEVKDCIEQFLELRKKTERIHRFVTEFGHTLPKTVKEQQYALRFMERKDAEEELQAALARRDTVGCPLQQKLPWTGLAARCELTGRPYWECCGRTVAGIPTKLQAHLQQPKR
ncbi:hypothetical protein VOLCADRAFT_119859, partial [Volvox carteri f. nagariensis]